MKGCTNSFCSISIPKGCLFCNSAREVAVKDASFPCGRPVLGLCLCVGFGASTMFLYCCLSLSHQVVWEAIGTRRIRKNPWRGVLFTRRSVEETKRWPNPSSRHDALGTRGKELVAATRFRLPPRWRSRLPFQCTRGDDCRNFMERLMGKCRFVHEPLLGKVGIEIEMVHILHGGCNGETLRSRN